jgi:hypothetical protein
MIILNLFSLCYKLIQYNSNLHLKKGLLSILKAGSFGSFKGFCIKETRNGQFEIEYFA